MMMQMCSLLLLLLLQARSRLNRRRVLSHRVGARAHGLKFVYFTHRHYQFTLRTLLIFQLARAVDAAASVIAAGFNALFIHVGTRQRSKLANGFSFYNNIYTRVFPEKRSAGVQIFVKARPHDS